MTVFSPYIVGIVETLNLSGGRRSLPLFAPSEGKPFLRDNPAFARSLRGRLSPCADVLQEEVSRKVFRRYGKRRDILSLMARYGYQKRAR